MNHFKCYLAIVICTASGLSAASLTAGPPYEKLEHHSRTLNSNENYWVMLPHEYDSQDNAQLRYPVIYGIQSRGGEFTELRKLMVAGVLPPMIVVGCDVDGGDRAWSNHQRPTEDYFIKELVPLIDTTYRTVTNRPGRVLYGNSKGGSGCLRLMLKYPALFSASVSLDGAMQLYDEKEFHADGESFAQLIKRQEAVQDHPVLLVGGGWFHDRAEKYFGNLKQWGMNDVNLVSAPECGHNGGLMIAAHGTAIAATFSNGLLGVGELKAPTIELNGKNVRSLRTIDPIRVTLASAGEADTIRYTLDGMPPSSESTRYTKAFSVETSASIRAASFSGDNGSRSREAFRSVEILPLQPSVDVKKTEPGLILQWFEYGQPREGLGEAKPVGRREVAGLPLKEVGLPDKRLFVLSGWIDIPAAGIYRFDLPERKTQLAIGSDAPLKPSEALFVALARGLHPIRIVHQSSRQRAEIATSLNWTGPDGRREVVPDEALRRPMD